MKTGFIGLGHLGMAMAKRLIAKGTDLIVWNRTLSKAAELGVVTAETPAKLAAQADVVFINLFDSGAVSQVLSGKEGIFEADCTGKIIIDTTTNHFEQVMQFHALLKEKGGSYLEAPVLGSVVPASNGALTVLVSGEQAAYEKALPLLQKIGKTIFHLPEPAIATKMKLINNLVLGSFMATLAEAVAFGESIGAGKAQVLDIFAAGAGNSAVLNAKKEKLLTNDFSTHFSSALIYKDLHYLQDLARTLKRPLLTGSIMKEIFGMTFPKGIDGLDFSGVYHIFSESQGQHAERG